MPGIEVAGRFQATVAYAAHSVPNLSPPSHPAPILTAPRPRGAAIRRYAVGGAGVAPAGGVTTHSREASGHRPGGTTAPVRGARWKAWRHRICGARTRQGRQRTEKRLSPFRDRPLHETKEIAQASLPNWRRGPQVSETPCRISAARRLKNAGKRSATGRADGGSIHPRRILAQWKRPIPRASRRSAAPHRSTNAATRAAKMHARKPAVMLGLIPSIHVLNTAFDQRRRGWSPQGRP
jgi:hypothetical protein